MEIDKAKLYKIVDKETKKILKKMDKEGTEILSVNPSVGVSLSVLLKKLRNRTEDQIAGSLSLAYAIEKDVLKEAPDEAARIERDVKISDEISDIYNKKIDVINGWQDGAKNGEEA
jgi:hypothetical protein